MTKELPIAQDFTLGSLLRFAAPAIGMMLTLSFYTVTDGIFIGRFIGDTALAASNIAYPGLNLILGIAIMCATGGSALVAKNLGEKKPQEASRNFTMILSAAFVFGIVLEIISFALLTSLLQLLGADDRILPLAQDYLGSLLLFTPFFIAKAIFDTFFIADGRPLFGFLVSLLSGCANIVLDALFICSFGWGICGAGLATGIANSAATLIGLVYFSRFSHTLRFQHFHLKLTVLRQTASNGLSEMVTQLSVGLTTYLFNQVVFARAGENGIAALSIILYIEMLLTAAYIGFMDGTAPILSYNYGAHNYARLKKLVKMSCQWIGMASLLTFALSHLLAIPLIHLFLPVEGTTYALTVQGLQFFSLSFLLCGFNIFIDGFFTAISHGRQAAICSFIRNLAGITLFLLLLPKLIGLYGVWLAVPAADCFALLFSGWILYQTLHSLSSYTQAETATQPVATEATQQQRT